MANSLSGARATQPTARLDLIGRLGRVATSDTILWVLVAAAASIIWVAPRPPMMDLSQHAAQITHLKAILLGQSAWAEDFRINLLTPYLVGYSAALLIAFTMPVIIALKIVLTAAFLAFVVSCRQLRAEVGGDRRLDVLFVPGFFGFAYDFGFYSFLVAAPIALQLIRFGWQHATAPCRRTGMAVVFAGCLLLLSHGLMFMFAGLVCGLLLLAHAPSFCAALRRSVPYVVLLGTAIAFALAAGSTPGAASWTQPEWWNGAVARLAGLLVFTQSSSDVTVFPLVLAMVGAAMLQARLGRWHRAIPFAAVVVVMMGMPDTALATDYLAGRFAVFVLPFLALLFVPITAEDEHRPLIAAASAVVMVAACTACIGLKIAKTHAFAVEAQDFETVLAAAQPGKKAQAATLIDTPASVAGAHASAYLHMATWYEVDKGGLVNFSFANFHPQIVRFRDVKPIERSFEKVSSFDWSRTKGATYFFARRAKGQWTPGFIENAPCGLRLVAEAGTWGLFERGDCAR